jgi:hypothetical protein
VTPEAVFILRDYQSEEDALVIKAAIISAMISAFLVIPSGTE